MRSILQLHSTLVTPQVGRITKQTGQEGTFSASSTDSTSIIIVPGIPTVGSSLVAPQVGLITEQFGYELNGISQAS